MIETVLPGTTPSARIVLELLLGPRAEVVVIQLEVRDPAGVLVALRSFPGSVHTPTVELLDKAWTALLDALPHETWAAHHHDYDY